ncbi:MAG: hypothetical protein V3V70_01110 [Candidatus Scalindua sp.]
MVSKHDIFHLSITDRLSEISKFRSSCVESKWLMDTKFTRTSILEQPMEIDFLFYTVTSVEKV